MSTYDSDLIDLFVSLVSTLSLDEMANLSDRIHNLRLEANDGDTRYDDLLAMVDARCQTRYLIEQQARSRARYAEAMGEKFRDDPDARQGVR